MRIGAGLKNWQIGVGAGVAAFTAVTAVAYSRSKERLKRVLESTSNPPYKVEGELVSIIIPTLNEDQYLPLLLESIKNQTYDPIEVLIADSYSTDKTAEIARSYGARVVLSDPPSCEFHDQKVAWTSTIAKARNDAASVAKGDLLLFVDADCAFEPSYVEKLVRALAESPNAVAAHGVETYYDASGPLHVVAGLWAWFKPKTYTARGVVVLRSAFWEVGGYKYVWREDIRLGTDLAEMFGPGSVIVVKDAVLAISARRIKKEGILGTWKVHGVRDGVLNSQR